MFPCLQSQALPGTPMVILSSKTWKGASQTGNKVNLRSINLLYTKRPRGLTKAVSGVWNFGTFSKASVALVLKA